MPNTSSGAGWVSDDTVEHSIEARGVLRSLCQVHRVRPQPVLRLREDAPHHLLCDLFDLMHCSISSACGRRQPTGSSLTNPTCSWRPRWECLMPYRKYQPIAIATQITNTMSVMGRRSLMIHRQLRTERIGVTG
jgi:hypothetical protein